jgi:hypothetical protein
MHTVTHVMPRAQVLRNLLGKWELQKRSFDGTSDLVLDLPPKLALLWRDFKRANYERYGAEVHACTGEHAGVCVLLTHRTHPG